MDKLDVLENVDRGMSPLCRCEKRRRSDEAINNGLEIAAPIDRGTRTPVD